jgi:glucose-6-phosphate 1-dehydrogenase
MSETIKPPAPSALLSHADPCVVVIFGASGDLTKRKLVPALFRLACAECVTNTVQVLGIGRDEMSSEQFRARAREGADTSPETGAFTDEEWVQFASRLHYFSGDLTNPETYRTLAGRLEELHVAGASSNTLYYCSTPPSLDPAIIDGLKLVGLEHEERGWSRIILEKPFGSDFHSARELNAKVASVFAEHQIYRIDHYLGKETVQNILVFRFGNSLFEPVWNRNYIDYVEITASETIGIGGRAGYYEGAGALRDMVANHLLQLLTLTAMEPPVAFDADSVREEKVQILRSILPLSPEEVAARTVRGQYGPGTIDGKPVPGYRQELGVAPSSTTETYIAVQFNVQNWRWAGVPFYLRAGKRLARHLTEVNVHFKATPCSSRTSSRCGSSPTRRFA